MSSAFLKYSEDQHKVDLLKPYSISLRAPQAGQQPSSSSVSYNPFTTRSLAAFQTSSLIQPRSLNSFKLELACRRASSLLASLTRPRELRILTYEGVSVEVDRVPLRGDRCRAFISFCSFSAMNAKLPPTPISNSVFQSRTVSCRYIKLTFVLYCKMTRRHNLCSMAADQTLRVAFDTPWQVIVPSGIKCSIHPRTALIW